MGALSLLNRIENQYYTSIRIKFHIFAIIISIPHKRPLSLDAQKYASRLNQSGKYNNLFNIAEQAILMGTMN